MIRITGFLHRKRFFDLIHRWMFNQMEPTDTDELLRLVHFNNVFVSRYLPLLSEGILGNLYHCAPYSRRVSTKGDLKDQIVKHLPYRNPRMDRLIADYQSDPGSYFRETPFQGTLYFCSKESAKVYMGSSRIKRVRRLAEKSARRLVDWIYDEIQRRAHHNVAEPNMKPGWEIHDFAQAGHLTAAELRQAEVQFLQQIRENRPSYLPEDLTINDVAGIKIIQETPEDGELQGILQEQNCRLVEQERHTGDYQATNLIVDYQPDKARILAQPLHSRIISVFNAHGIGGDEANRLFREFVDTGEESVRVEIIVSNYLQMMESEIGRCMHEDRIIRQRRNQVYQGQLGSNVEFLMEYLFLLPAVPDGRPESLPIRLWDRYLPDYFDEVKRTLFHLPSVELNEL